jgi:hypothetical protein
MNLTGPHRNELGSHGNTEITIVEKHDTAKSHEDPQPKHQALKETVQSPAAEFQLKKGVYEVFFVDHYIVKQLEALDDIEMTLYLARERLTVAIQGRKTHDGFLSF